MLSDFLTLELYFGQPESALFFEDLTRHYSLHQIRNALETGDIKYRKIEVGPDKGRFLYSLSEQGRFKLAQE